MKKISTLSSIVLSSVCLGALGNLPSYAFTLGNNTVKGITAADIGQMFTVNFDGSVGINDVPTNVPGLTSKAEFTINSFSTNSVVFDIILSNNSSNGITSRTAAIGWNTNPNISSASAGAVPGSGFLALFDTAVVGGKFPNEFGDIEVCFKKPPNNGPNNCQGGAQGGVTTGNSGLFRATLNFASPISSLGIDLSNFGVRYQSINGPFNGTTFNDASGTGRGTVVIPPGGPTPVPEPSSFLGTAFFLGFGSFFAYRRKQKTMQQAA